MDFLIWLIYNRKQENTIVNMFTHVEQKIKLIDLIKKFQCPHFVKDNLFYENQQLDEK